MEDEDIAPNTYSWYSRYGQNVVPVHYTGIYVVYWRNFLPIPTGSAVCISSNFAGSHLQTTHSSMMGGGGILNLITINQPVDYMAWGFMIFMRGVDITRAIGRVGLKVDEPVLGPEIARDERQRVRFGPKTGVYKHLTFVFMFTSRDSWDTDTLRPEGGDSHEYIGMHI